MICSIGTSVRVRISRQCLRSYLHKEESHVRMKVSTRVSLDIVDHEPRCIMVMNKSQRIAMLKSFAQSS